MIRQFGTELPDQRTWAPWPSNCPPISWKVKLGEIEHSELPTCQLIQRSCSASRLNDFSGAWLIPAPRSWLLVSIFGKERAQVAGCVLPNHHRGRFLAGRDCDHRALCAIESSHPSRQQPRMDSFGQPGYELAAFLLRVCRYHDLGVAVAVTPVADVPRMPPSA